MRINLLHHFTATSAHCLDTYLAEEQLGILFRGILPGAPPYSHLTSLALVDIPQKQCISMLTYDGHGPETEDTWSACLRYDSSQKRWVIALLQSLSYIALRTVTMGANNSMPLSPLCLLDYNESHDEGFHPLLDLETSEQYSRVFYHKPSQEEHRTAAIVVKQDVVLHQPGWTTLEDDATVVRSNDNGNGIFELSSWQEWLIARKQQLDSLGGSDQHHTVLLPTQNPLDAERFKANQIPEIEMVDQTEFAETENALTFAAQQTRLLVLCCPENWVWPNEGSRSEAEIEQTGEQWRIWLTGWERAKLTHQWTYSPAIGLLADPNVPVYEHPRSPAVEVATVAGPHTRDNQPTFVATMSMQGEAQFFSHGVCLTHDGQLVQVCNEPLGRYPSLCICQQNVIGVDRLETGWHMWNWAVLDESTLQTSMTLESACQRAFVRSQPDADRFWLIEELPTGVRVSLRDARTLIELTPAELIAQTKLLSEQSDRPLEPHRNTGLIPYQETLLLLLEGIQGELILYQAL